MYKKQKAVVKIAFCFLYNRKVLLSYYIKIYDARNFVTKIFFTLILQNCKINVI